MTYSLIIYIKNNLFSLLWKKGKHLFTCLCGYSEAVSLYRKKALYAVPSQKRPCTYVIIYLQEVLTFRVHPISGLHIKQHISFKLFPSPATIPHSQTHQISKQSSNLAFLMMHIISKCFCCMQFRWSPHSKASWHPVDLSTPWICRDRSASKVSSGALRVQGETEDRGAARSHPHWICV